MKKLICQEPQKIYRIICRRDRDVSVSIDFNHLFKNKDEQDRDMFRTYVNLSINIEGVMSRVVTTSVMFDMESLLELKSIINLTIKEYSSKYNAGDPILR